jgi:hypothetical protein
MPSPPALETAAARAGETTPPIGAWTIGSSMLSREQRDVCNTGMMMHLAFLGRDNFYGYFNLLYFQDMAPPLYFLARGVCWAKRPSIEKVNITCEKGRKCFAHSI